MLQQRDMSVVLFSLNYLDNMELPGQEYPRDLSNSNYSLILWTVDRNAINKQLYLVGLG